MEDIAVGDRVRTATGTLGNVLALHGDRAWVLVDGNKGPLTVDTSKLKRAPKFAVGDMVVPVKPIGFWYPEAPIGEVVAIDGEHCWVRTRKGTYVTAKFGYLEHQ